jgi:hypothetical protein
MKYLLFGLVDWEWWPFREEFLDYLIQGAKSPDIQIGF